ncbi:hypothetical protein QBC33DRAFT_555463 [Phialemonium atrogriseum]|uniref:Peroxin/Ferlin domain-containing protein n=1 Tax=Phialemonium atrogriseum TaxID=1093897 RepID=A0AAJ0FJU4_9PEZI|nr:uncharacterized protein QBC33DRAFT_555463 [Phialemonium atrogriseum]KAK1770966.1 hypothetical protein QBC33DRAFT_555463 [Phialemonium atrogriseum]
MKPRSSRRAPPLKDSDFDHEINLVDHSTSDLGAPSLEEGALRSSTSEPGIVAGPSSSGLDSPPAVDNATAGHDGPTQGGGQADNSGQPTAIKNPLVEIEEPTPAAEDNQPKGGNQTVKVKPKSPESAIDILYENQRGGFLCGIPLFSSKALGNLDPAAWTNSAHRHSPTDTQTAQVPDPSWEWAWPEWKINHDDGVDEDGWEYSFMFTKNFSWHGPSWWNSFVRRRAWIRRRVKKGTSYTPQDPLRLNPEYFTIRPASAASHSRSPSRATASRRGSIISTGTSQAAETEELERPDIEDMESLLSALRVSRIDREKIEAVDNYLEHGQHDDLIHLQEEMHDIMALFVFQASRKVLLARLTEVHDETQKKLEEDDSDTLRRRAADLAAAVKQADEEVKKLEYWSDVKAMAEEGKSKGAVDGGEGWDDAWRGLDKSGPAGPDPKRAQP